MQTPIHSNQRATTRWLLLQTIQTRSFWLQIHACSLVRTQELMMQRPLTTNRCTLRAVMQTARPSWNILPIWTHLRHSFHATAQTSSKSNPWTKWCKHLHRESRCVTRKTKTSNSSQFSRPSNQSNQLRKSNSRPQVLSACTTKKDLTRRKKPDKDSKVYNNSESKKTRRLVKSKNSTCLT